MLLVAAALGLVVRARPALLPRGLAPGLAPGLSTVLAPGPVTGAPVRASRLRLSASSEPPELTELPAYPMSIYIEDTDAFAVTCAQPAFEPAGHRSADRPMRRPARHPCSLASRV